MHRRLRSGDLVEVKQPHEIMATLDEHGCLDNLPYMPEMLRFCGRRFRVSKRAHKTCDTIHQTGGRRIDGCVHLDDLRCDGSEHDGCKASCLLFWKEAWLRRIDADDGERDGPDTPPRDSAAAAEELRAHTRRAGDDGTPVYRCQATALFEASRPLAWWDPRQYLEDLSSGNVRIRDMIRVCFFHALHKLMGLGVGYRLWRRIYDYLQPRIGGFEYPFRSGVLPDGEATPSVTLNLEPGERVRIRSHEEILSTLDRKKRNRGMRFDAEMVPYCERTFTVQKRVDRIIHEGTGRMVEIKSPSVILDGVVCRSEFSSCRLFCPRAIPSYWREIWLERAQDDAATARSARHAG